ncbi:MAG: MlaD family protein [Actinomycetota bacterium]|nr:MlaD family protein [Actinomycetota bacterium]
MRTGRQASIVASPVLIGALTMLVIIVAVFLAYNANQGLPFVPTFDVKAQLEGGQNLVVSNDVRVGGARVGAVDTIKPGVDPKTGKAIAIVHMKLDKKVEPIPKDSTVYVRPRSNLGLKYVELTLGKSATPMRAGDTLPVAQSTTPTELDQYFSTFDEDMRENTQRAQEGFGDALAGRGQSINLAIEQFVPFLTHLTPVMTALSDPDTRLNQFFRSTSRFSGEIAPVARSYAELFGNMATTFEALARDENALRATIERGPPTLDAGIQSFPVQRPFLADSERLFRHLRPVADEFERSLPGLREALVVGRPVVRSAPPFYERTANVFRSLRELAADPNTLLGLKDLTTLVRVGAPLLEWIAPFQTVCNYTVYWLTGLGEHVSEDVRFGTAQRSGLKSDNRTQDNRISASDGEKPADIPDNQDPQTDPNQSGPNSRGRDQAGDPLTTLHRQNYSPAIDAQGNADCQTTNTGYLDGPLATGFRYPPSNDPNRLGGSHVVVDPDQPWLSGPTKVGVKNLKDVP